MTKETSLSDIQLQIRKFCDERNWDQFHNPKDLAISLNLEASELLEHFQWKNETEILHYLESHRDNIAEEISDVLYWTLLIANKFEINLVKAFEQKMLQNEHKYPVDKSHSSAKKYTEL